MGSSWADHAIKALDNGDAVTIRPRGNSMTPRIKTDAAARAGSSGTGMAGTLD